MGKALLALRSRILTFTRTSKMSKLRASVHAPMVVH
jgi:hypothetical protein